MGCFLYLNRHTKEKLKKKIVVKFLKYLVEILQG